MSLTGRSYFLIALICLLGILGQWLGTPLNGLWRAPAGLMIFALVCERYLRTQQRFTLHWKSELPLTLGITSRITARLENLTTRNLNIEYQPSFAGALKVEPGITKIILASQEHIEQPLNVIPVSLGVSQLGTTFVRVRGWFGLAWWPSRRKHDDTIDIVPTSLSSRHNQHAATLKGDKRTSRAIGSGDEILMLRDYQTGDPPHLIDWKATARRQYPVTRVYQRDEKMNILLMLDTGRTSSLQAGNLSRLNHYINAAARLAELASMNGDNIGLVTYADSIQHSQPVSGGRRALHSVRTILQSLRCQSRESNPLPAILSVRNMLPQRGLVVIFSAIEDEEAATQLIRATQILIPKHKPLIASLVDTDVLDLKHKPATHWLDPYRNYAASEYLSAIRLSILHLQKLGANVVSTIPDDLDANILSSYQKMRLLRQV